MSITRKLSELFGVKAPDTVVIEVRPASEFTPTVEEYFFMPSHIKKLMLWTSSKAPIKNLALLGGKGVGKTALVQQFCARMGLEVFPISCSGKTRFADLVGTLTIAKDGSTQFVDGPLTMAYRRGGIFLGNEITRMDPGEQMRLVDVLDGHSRLTIPQTGEVLVAHPDFRFAGTGNSGGHGDETGAYAGEKISSTAFFDRFMKIEMEGMSFDDEKSYIAKIIGQEDFAETMVRFARDCRSAFVGAGGGCRIDISPRATIMWARLSVEYREMSGINALQEALDDVVLNGSPKEDREAVTKLYQKFFRIS